MESIKQHQEYLTNLHKSLSGEDITAIDFDQMLIRLKQITADLQVLEKINEEYNLLKADISGRIAGMAKATAIAKKNTSKLKDALSLIQSLPGLPAEKLITTYQREQARFRDTFAVSFGMLDPMAGGKRHRYDEYK